MESWSDQDLVTDRGDATARIPPPTGTAECPECGQRRSSRGEAPCRWCAGTYRHDAREQTQRIMSALAEQLWAEVRRDAR